MLAINSTIQYPYSLFVVETVISTSYLYGLTTLLLIALLGSGTKLSVDQQRQYERIMRSVDVQAEYSGKACNNVQCDISCYRSKILII